MPSCLAEKSPPCPSTIPRKLVTSSSRPTTNVAIQGRSGLFGKPARAIMAPQMMILSTKGSSIRPSFVTWLYRRAHQPSTQSVLAATTKQTMAAKKKDHSTRPHTTRARTNLTVDRTLGTFQFDGLLDSLAAAFEAALIGELPSRHRSSHSLCR